MSVCALCGDYESEHEETRPGSRFLGRCRTRQYHELVNGDGEVVRRDYDVCDCPGYEAEDTDA